MSYPDKAGDMARILANLTSRYQQLLSTPKQVGWLDNVLLPMKALKSALGITDMANSIESVIYTTNKGLEILNEKRPQALNDDKFFEEVWLDLAESMDAGISQALNMSRIGVSTFVTKTAETFVTNVKNVAETTQNTTIPLLVVGLVAVAVIVVFK